MASQSVSVDFMLVRCWTCGRLRYDKSVRPATCGTCAREQIERLRAEIKTLELRIRGLKSALTRKGSG